MSTSTSITPIQAKPRRRISRAASHSTAPPSGLGVWVYAPKGTPNYWLWTQIAYYDEASGTYKRSYLHFTTQEGRSLLYRHLLGGLDVL